MSEEAETQARAARHAIYKEGTATHQQVADRVVTEESLKAKGFVRNEHTKDWYRVPKGDR